MKLKFGIKGILIVLVICLSLITTILTLNEVNIAKVITQEQTEKKKRTKTRQVPPMIRNANDTLTNATYRDLNGSVNPSHLNDFKEARRKWDFKLIDSQISDIFEMMHKPSVQYKTAADDRAFLEIFFNEFYNYDANKDNQWDIAEMTVAFKNDTYISKLLPPPEIFAVNKKYANAEDFYQKIFEILDIQNSGFINFHAYMELRMYIFSWRKCSVLGPYIEETSWECAIEIVSGYKTNSRTTLRNTFYMAMELVNANGVRNIDFISFMQFSSGARLYSKINGKQDNDVTCIFFNFSK